MFGLGAGEIAIIVVLAVILWGPDKLPELARKTARLVRFFRQVANDAQVTVRNELGPGFEDFDITDPKGSVRRYVMKQGGLDGVDDLVKTLRDASAELDEAASDLRRSIDTDGDGVISPEEASAAGIPIPAAPFDAEAT
ncbi:Sec-independent protein translocase subunit TatB [Raineyella sp.]|uniref:Sec-independent protein translocase protein TatB n=1 Tax=bioreactor metagenome TaxID=1076179 RepID=A0A645B7P7_9ZZZZ|nr:Sec-independent protein translocase subunit TatB [Raineyella sp.]MEA5154776.1 Sec-independent protein translocase subunit TatB [Raineyella sp.]